MKTKNIPVIFMAAVLFLFSFPLILRAQTIEAPIHIPGTIEGVGTHFEITDSEYLNITLDSSESISAKIESAPEMIVLEIEASDDFASTNLNISGLNSSTTYHKYTDDYHNYAPITSDEKGAFSFEEDLSQDRVIFIQPRKSTKLIYEPNGGDCSSIGNWNASSKTCTLSKDVFETVQIYSKNTTLDGGGHNIIGKGTGTGVYASGYRAVIKNVNISNFFYGIYSNNNGGHKIESSVLENNRYGISLRYSAENEISGNIIKNSNVYGISLFSSAGNIIYGNVIEGNQNSGIFQQFSGNSVLENNIISNNKYDGAYVYQSSGNILRGNKIENNLNYGISIVYGSNIILKNNVLSGNSKGNLDMSSNSNMAGNDIDTSNTSEGKPIYYLKNISNKTFDSTLDIGSFYCINCENITLKDVSLAGNRPQIIFWYTNNSVVEKVSSQDKSVAFNLYYSNGNTIKNNNLAKIDLDFSNNNTIYSNNFSDFNLPARASSSSNNLYYLALPTGGNYWKKNESTCKDINNDGFCDSSFFLYSGTGDRYPLVKEIDFNAPTCCSSVMFLPGHQSSRLYKKDLSGEDQLWEPTNHNQDVEQLFLDSNGESINSDVYTRDIIGSAYWGIKNVYKNFIISMEQVVSEGIIKEWKPVPYDWRLPLEEIADNGVKLENNAQMDIISEIEKMAAMSKTKKVTLIGHSNGGLLGKVLVQKLQEKGKENLVDKLILVATPQLGTPKAIASLLHGDDTDVLGGVASDKETGRTFGENMVSAYNLLPSKEYFNIVQTPVIEFDSGVENIYDFRTLYGENINGFDEFKKFLLGDNNARVEPKESDLDSPNVLRDNLLSKAEETHNKLDLWQAPEGLEVVQIAGWGLDTISGIKYSDCDSFLCLLGKGLDDLKRELVLKQDGDKTVVVPSALEMGGNAERYYLDIKK